MIKDKKQQHHTAIYLLGLI